MSIDNSHFDSSGYYKPPVSPEGLNRIFNSISWYSIFNHYKFISSRIIDENYGNFSTVNILKAITLPFMINIPTERALARELEERGLFQSVCGFLPGDVPSRGTLWNFRRKYQKEYPDLLVLILTTMALIGKELNFKLPFTFNTNPNEVQNSESKFKFAYYPQQLTHTNDSTNGALQLELRRFPKSDNQSQIQNSKKQEIQRLYELGFAKDWQEWKKINHKYTNTDRSWLRTDLLLPAIIRVKDIQNSSIINDIKIDAPDWLETQGKDKDTVAGFRSSAIPYIACNVLVIRQSGENKQVLLSKRQSGSGEGTYALPGGKVKNVIGETVEECATRELKEETSMSIIKSRPISIRITHFPGKPWVISIGAIAEAVSGKPRTIEKLQHGIWKWFDITHLPEPLFEPTRIVVSHYISGIYSNLKWQDLESIIKKEIEQTKMF